jgi:membrane protease YdiL (CAAX protease family)
MVAFLLSGVMSAVILIVRHAYDVGGSPNPVPLVVPNHPLASLLLGVPYYLVVAAIVPLVLLLLRRTGQGRGVLGLGLPGWRSDIWPAIGLIGAGWGSEIVLLIPLADVLKGHPGLLNQTSVLHVPHYYVIYGLAISATTAVAEEVIVNGYLLVRLNQLGWTPRSALILSLVLRTSYHIYYGLGFIFTIPLGYFFTRSFQKRGRLTRVILAHFLYDAILISIAVLR